MKEKIYLRKATIKDAKIIHKLLNSVYEQFESKDLCGYDSLDYVKEQIKNTGFAIVAYLEDKTVVGSLIFRFSHVSEDNLDYDVNLPYIDLNKLVYIELAAVLPQYRKNNIQELMLSLAEILIDKEKYKYFLASVAPDDFINNQTFQNNGYKIITTKINYNGLLRNIYLKEV